MEPSSLSFYWLMGGLLLMVLEIILPGGICFFLGVSATLVAGTIYIGVIDNLLSAFTSWFLISLALLLGLKGVSQKILGTTITRSNTDEDVDAYDQIVEVVEKIPPNGTGRIHFRGTTWTARSYHNNDDIGKGEYVRIIFRENLTWVVERV